MFAKALKLAAVLAVGAVTLAGCTPPMPPEVAAALAEQTYVCQNGSVNVALPSAMSDDFPMITDAMAANCSGMAATRADTGASAQLFIDSNPPAASVCNAGYTAPFALDAGVISATLANAAGLTLSPKTVAGIFDGSIKNWDSKAIKADNSGQTIATGPISVLPITDANALKAFSAWYQYLTGKAFKPSLIKAKKSLEVSNLGTLAEGTIALLPYSTFSAYSVYAEVIPLAANIVVSKKSPEGVTADSSGIGSAGTQLKLTKSNKGIKVKMDYTAKPIPPLGSDVAQAPYGATYPINISLCGKATLVERAVARYLLRQDSQGTLTTFVALPEALRGESLVGVSKGLPTPKATPQQ